VRESALNTPALLYLLRLCVIYRTVLRIPVAVRVSETNQPVPVNSKRLQAMTSVVLHRAFQCRQVSDGYHTNPSRARKLMLVGQR
jgi:hypothetical protein